MKFTIYLLINENYKKTYIGYSDDIKRRVKEHRLGKVKTTKDFGKFRCFILEKLNNIVEARKREKYWKSHAGRKKIKECFNKISPGPIV